MKHHEDCDVYQATIASEGPYGDETIQSTDYSCLSACGQDWLDDLENFKDGAFVTLSTPDMYTDFDLTGEQLKAFFMVLTEMEN